MLIGAKVITETTYVTPSQFSLHSVYNNPLFKIGNRVIQEDRLGNTGTTQVADFLHTETNLPLTLEQYNSKYNCDVTNAMYTPVINSLNRALTKLDINWGNITMHPAPRQSVLISVATKTKKGSSAYYKLLMCRKIQRRDTSRQETRWHTELGLLLSIKYWDSCWHDVHDIKNNELKYFQYQVVRGNLKTNAVVSHFVPLVQETCSFPGCNEREIISHLMWDCQTIQTFWRNLSLFFTNTFHTPIFFEKLTVLFGLQNQLMSSVTNTVILVGKKYIWQEKFRNLAPNVDNFCKYLKQFLRTEKVAHTMKNNLVSFENEWGAIITLLDEYLQDEPGDVEEPPT